MLEPSPAIPEDTARAARAIFGKSNFYLCIGDSASSQIGGFDHNHQPGLLQTPARLLTLLSLITIFQYVETLPDQKAADATRERVDWKYALHLPLNYPGLEARRLCDFRKWLLTDCAARENFQRLLVTLPEILSKSKVGYVQWDAVHVLKTVCLVSRLASVWEAMSGALEALATRQPEWLRSISLPHWYERYSRHKPNLYEKNGIDEREKLAQAIGIDGFYLLQKITASNTPALEDLPEVYVLKHIWLENYSQSDGEVLWRKDTCAG